MDQENSNGAGQPNGQENGHENGIKRPHQSSTENNYEQEPDVKRVRVDASNDADNDLTPSHNKPVEESKVDQNAAQTEAKADGEVGDSSAVPRGTAVIKPK